MPGTDSQFWGIVFVSSSKKELALEDLKRTLVTGRHDADLKKNTGLAVHSVGNNLVYLEGDKDSVKKGYENALSNVAHHSLIKMFEGPVPQRFFEDYSVAFKALSPEEFKAFNDFESPEGQEYFKEFLEIDHIVPRLIKDFIKNNL